MAFALAFSCPLLWAAGAHAFIYWSSLNGGSIGRANLDGTGVNQLFITGATQADGAAVDGHYIYWANMNGSVPGGGSIGRANLDGSGVNQNFITGVGNPAGVAVSGGFIYWANRNGGQFAAAAGGPYGTIGRASVDGTGADPSWAHYVGDETMANQSTVPFYLVDGVTVAGGNIYWDNDYTGSVASASLANPNATAAVLGGDAQSFWNAPSGPASDGQHVFWANQGDGSIERTGLDGTGSGDLAPPGTAWKPTGVALDQHYIYISDFSLNSGAGSIGRMNLDGTGLNLALIQGLSSPSAIAVDAGAPPPVTTISLSPAQPNGSAGWYTTPVRVSVAASGFYPATDVRCALDPAAPFTSLAAFPMGCGYAGAGAPVAAGGAHTVYAAAQDDHGEPGAVTSATFRIDGTPPALTCLGNPVFLLGSTGTTVSATVADSGSGPAAPSASAVVSAARQGAFSAAVTGHDFAGNSASVNCPYVVKAPTIQATMQWTFQPPGAHSRFTSVRSLVVPRLPSGAAVTLACAGRGCPLRSRKVAPAKCARKRCRQPAAGQRFDLTRFVRGRRFPPGTVLTASLSEPNRRTKVYRFAMQRRGLPQISFTCPASGGVPAGC